jgi:hypothetical protein
MEIWQLVIYGLAGFVMSILSGISGGGAGFVITPLAIFLGLTPAQAVATNKLAGLSVTVGSLSGMRSERGRVTWRRIVPVMVLALLVGLLVPFIITSLDQGLYRVILGVMLLLLIPVVIIRRMGVKTRRPGRWRKYAGGGLLTGALLVQGAFGGGLGVLVNVVLMGMLGMSAIEANITKRWSQLILNVTIVLGVLGSGLILWQVAAVGAATTLVGSYIGGRLAVGRGDGFVVTVMVVLMFVSAVALLLGA